MNKEKERTINQKKRRVEDSDSDWLSSLPDSILIEILSKLKARELIQTCVLSKRWLKLWTFVPCVDFNYSEFKREETSDDESRDIERFENFVSSVLRLRDDATDLHTFIICHLRHYNTKTAISGNVASTWILYALKHNPKKLDIMLFANNLVHLPDSLFTCESLEKVRLRLEMEEDIKEIKPDNVCLPRLRELSFTYFSFNANFLQKLLIGCPILESLGLYGCTLEMTNISFRNLKKLSVIDCYFASDEGEVLTGRISAPGLESLYFRGETGSGIKLEDMSSVTEATIIINDDMVTCYDFELFSSLSGVENLKIDSNILEDTLKTELPKCPIFSNLKSLTLSDACMYCRFGLLPPFLSRCPNLEFLTLSHVHQDVPDEHVQDEPSHNLEQIETFGCSHLKKIDIHFTRHDHHVDLLMRLLLRSTFEMEDLKFVLSKSAF